MRKKLPRKSLGMLPREVDNGVGALISFTGNQLFLRNGDFADVSIEFLKKLTVDFRSR